MRYYHQEILPEYISRLEKSLQSGDPVRPRSCFVASNVPSLWGGNIAYDSPGRGNNGLSIYEVKPIGTPAPVKAHPCGYHVPGFTVVKKVPFHLAYGPNGEEVLKLLQQLDNIDSAVLERVARETDAADKTWPDTAGDDEEPSPGSWAELTLAVSDLCEADFDEPSEAEIMIRQAYQNFSAEMGNGIGYLSYAAHWYREGLKDAQTGSGGNAITMHDACRFSGLMHSRGWTATHAIDIPAMAYIARKKLTKRQFDILTTPWNRAASVSD